MAKTFEVEIKYQDREKGPGAVAGKAVVTAGSMAAAIGKAVREILDKTDRKQNFDMQKHGIEISVRSSTEAAEEEKPDEAAESAAGAINAQESACFIYASSFSKRSGKLCNLQEFARYPISIFKTT